jgi:hypothetical protein
MHRPGLTILSAHQTKAPAGERREGFGVVVSAHNATRLLAQPHCAAPVSLRNGHLGD